MKMFFLYGNIILLQCLSFTISAVAFHFLMYHVKNMILLQMVHGRFFTWIIYISTWTIREQQNKTVCFDKRSNLTNSFKQSELVKHISGTTIYRKHLSYKVKDHQGILVICMNKILSCESNPLIQITIMSLQSWIKSDNENYCLPWRIILTFKRDDSSFSCIHCSRQNLSDAMMLKRKSSTVLWVS